MGAELSKPAEPNPCAGEMGTYVNEDCRERGTARRRGCEKESEAYRECRRKVKELKAAVKK
ncbi:Purple acid phosphatase 3 [Phytophthora nicotianae]|uniref:Purple acid phosphatase 3 n=1 Tax=Phytophthora nicotianae TaxID=4792 RepID=A0A0W8CSJ8_PHYNI|nr:Purple acid phosphatase 3 [Phytophthora nicotianae]